MTFRRSQRELFILVESNWLQSRRKVLMSPKKPGKQDVVLVALGDSPEQWNDYLLRTYGLPQDPQPRNEVSESAFISREGRRSTLEALAVRQIKLGEEPPKGLLKVWAENGGDENEPTEKWTRSQGFLRLFARIFAHDKQLEEL